MVKRLGGSGWASTGIKKASRRTAAAEVASRAEQRREESQSDRNSKRDQWILIASASASHRIASHRICHLCSVLCALHLYLPLQRSRAPRTDGHTRQDTAREASASKRMQTCMHQSSGTTALAPDLGRSCFVERDARRRREHPGTDPVACCVSLHSRDSFALACASSGLDITAQVSSRAHRLIAVILHTAYRYRYCTASARREAAR